ncbi:GDP-mannose 4,6-dehydratase [Pseudoduganella namucuonensis]|uniref:GDP-mannose 4,6-dehydratase n=1 Tax=Pseudoduganella namucuonensis TaxID=1035707 RepID=A0A1I7K2L5_9BURK|nr:GDP-mannose 4,6-dehydratase [Pseudoduganella namucuonensis]SFU91686.1 GDPmannose 4,6-dehydratase [Pseudoduganella namucuonensis]
MHTDPALPQSRPAAAGKSPAKVALITGVTGQDGAYLAELLLSKGYRVHGIRRRSSLPNTARIDHLLAEGPWDGAGLTLHDGDMTDASSLMRIVAATAPDEVYNLAAQSDVAISFAEPEYTADAGALGPLRLLEAIRALGMGARTRYYQASTSELFGRVRETPQRESTPFAPCSPYAAAKLYAYWITVNYREAYGMYACNGILFNHESPRRGENFVTRKITRALARIACGERQPLSLGNLDSLRDWGHARDYVEMQWLMLQQAQPDDYVIASGSQRSVRDFVTAAAARLGISLDWHGAGLRETAVVRSVRPDHVAARHCVPGQLVVQVDPRFFRPNEVDTLLGDAGKARRALGWQPRCGFDELVDEMVQADLQSVQRALLAAAPLETAHAGRATPLAFTESAQPASAAHDGAVAVPSPGKRAGGRRAGS